MALGNILRNLCSFFEVLDVSQSMSIQCWEEDAVDKAIKWSTFAEQVYIQSVGKSYCDQLNAEIRRLHNILSVNGNIPFSLVSLKNSKQCLVKNLLQNKCLKPSMVSYLASSDHHIDQVSTELCNTAAVADLLTGVRSTCQFSSIVVSPAIELQAQLLQHLANIVLTDQRSKQKFSEKMRLFTSDYPGICQLAVCVTCVNKSPEVNRLFVECFLQQLHSNELIVWLLPAGLLAAVSCMHTDVHVKYLEYLTRCGNAFQIDYDAVKQNASNPWRYVQCHGSVLPDAMNYEDLLESFCALCNSDSLLVRQRTRQTIEQNIVNSHKTNCWKQLLMSSCTLN